MKSLLALLLLLSGAAAEAASYRIEEIAVADGNPVAGQPGGVIYKGSPADCTTPPDTEIKPVSTFLKAKTKLRVRIAGCQPGLPEPRIECLAGPGSRERFEGWEHHLPLSLPDHTGVHRLLLSCSAGGQGIGQFTADLYLTFQAPRPIFREPPPAQWYELAARFASGFRAQAREEVVLKSLLSGTYAYGQEKWRYGFCEVQEDKKNCTFDPTTVPTAGLVCGIPGLCRCHWYQILPGGSPPGCNFSTCFGFSEVFEFMAALMGIGGLKDFVEEGRSGNGFVLHPWARANDPALPGFLHCGYRDLLCGYFFLNHDLRKRGLLWYDATFGRIYNHLDELILQDVVSFSASKVEFEKGAACYRTVGYGQWIYYDLVTQIGACGPVPNLVIEKPPSPALGIPEPPATFKKVEASWNGTEMKVTAAMNVKEKGTYAFDTRLSENGRTVRYYGTSFDLEPEKERLVSFSFRVEEDLEVEGSALTVVLYSADPLRHLDDEEVEIGFKSLPD